MTIEKHPFTPFLPAGAKVLMLGTFPPKSTRWTMDFYYPNFINDMWRIVGLVFCNDKDRFVRGRSFDQDSIMSFCAEKGIALYDTASEIRRLKDNASDKFLDIVTPTDTGQLLRQLPECLAVVATGAKAAEVLCETFACPCPRWENTPSSHSKKGSSVCTGSPLRHEPIRSHWKRKRHITAACSAKSHPDFCDNLADFTLAYRRCVRILGEAHYDVARIQVYIAGRPVGVHGAIALGVVFLGGMFEFPGIFPAYRLMTGQHHVYVNILLVYLQLLLFRSESLDIDIVYEQFIAVQLDSAEFLIQQVMAAYELHQL